MNDHIPDEVKRCNGRNSSDPVYPVVHQDCMNCVRLWAELRNRDYILPWTGHGPCPDKLEMEK